MDEHIPYPGDCLSLLKVMDGSPWNDQQTQRYSLALDRLDEALGQAVVFALCQQKWRPSPEEILEAAAQRISPFPSVDDAYLEMVWKAENVGIFGQPDPNRPSVMLAGPPPFSHPLVTRAVAVCGGWRAICTGEAQFQEGLSKQFRGAYERLSRDWIKKVISVLQKPVIERPASLVPRWRAFVLPTGWQEPTLHPALPPAPSEPLHLISLEELPEGLRRQMGRISREFPNSPDDLREGIE